MTSEAFMLDFKCIFFRLVWATLYLGLALGWRRTQMLTSFMQIR